MIVSEEGERNFRDVVLRTVQGESAVRVVNDAVRDGRIDENSILTTTLAGPLNEGGNYFLCVSIKVTLGKARKEKSTSRLWSV